MLNAAGELQHQDRTGSLFEGVIDLLDMWRSTVLCWKTMFWYQGLSPWKMSVA